MRYAIENSGRYGTYCSVCGKKKYNEKMLKGIDWDKGEFNVFICKDCMRKICREMGVIE